MRVPWTGRFNSENVTVRCRGERESAGPERFGLSVAWRAKCSATFTGSFISSGDREASALRVCRMEDGDSITVVNAVK